MNIVTILILNILIVAHEAVAKDGIEYCRLGCADPDKKHAVCANIKQKLMHNCPDDTKIMPLGGLQSLILQLHNERREFVASGKDETLPPAARMGELFWDDELAELAEYSVRRCLISDPYCYTTPSLPNPGRSATIYKYQATEDTFAELVPTRIIEWLETARECTAEMAAAFPENPEGHVEFFGRAITDSNNQVGCAASEWIKKTDKYFLLVCLYTCDVESGRRLYKFGHTASRCLTGTSSNFKSLCSTKEDYNITDSEHVKRKIPNVNSFIKKTTTMKYDAPEGSLWQLIM